MGQITTYIDKVFSFNWSHTHFLSVEHWLSEISLEIDVLFFLSLSIKAFFSTIQAV